MNGRNRIGGSALSSRIGLAALLVSAAACTRAAPGDGTVTARGALTAPSTPSEFAFLASGRLAIGDRSTVGGGHVGIGPGSGDSISAGFDARIGVGRALIGQRIVLQDRAVAGDLFANQVVAPHATFASISPYSTPPSPPPVVAFTAGSAGASVATGQTRTLAPGKFGLVTVNGTLRLSGGLYELQNLTIGNDGVLIANAPSTVRVAGRVTGADRVRIGPAAPLAAGSLRIVVAGASDATGGVQLANDGQLAALVLSNAAVRTGDRLIASGAIGARDVVLGKDARFTFETGFACTSDGACSDGNPCTTDRCVDAQCVHSVAPNGTACNDANPCTRTDVCTAGACVGTNPVVCQPTDGCHQGGTCNPTNGLCEGQTTLPDGTACNDHNACTQTDTCAAGTCVGSSPVVCVAPDACHQAGTCNPATGVCQGQSPVANGSPCDDGNACTQTDSCVAGTCAGGNPVVCVAPDTCHRAGTCNPTNGVCEGQTAFAFGTGCNDSNSCTQTDICFFGLCLGLNPVVCVAPDACHTAGSCNTTNGACESQTPVADGSVCNDGNGCTKTDVCMAGTCQGSDPVVCTPPDDCHTAGTCNPADGVCRGENALADGTACNDGNPCSSNDVCMAGTCTGSGTVTSSCQDPNVITSNHGLSVATLGRDLFSIVQNVTSKIGASVAAGRNLGAKGSQTCVNARIDNVTWSFVQESIDFTTVLHASQVGCSGGDDEKTFSGPHELKQLEIKRYHRPKFDFQSASSFGLGVFSEFDLNLTIYPAGGGTDPTVVLFDPRSDAPPITFSELSPDDGDNAVDGAYHDKAARAYRSLVLLDAGGTQTASQSAAATARLTKHNGEVMLFEVINTLGGSSPASLSGRLTNFTDRNNNTFAIHYVFPRNASDADLGSDPMKLWEIDTVTDMEGVSAQFQYVDSAATGRHMVQYVRWQDGATTRQLQYSYSPVSSTSGEEPDRLIAVTFPNGDQSTFQRVFDSASQNFRLEFNDVTEGNGMNHIFVYVTGLFYITGDLVIHIQPPGLVRKVINADNERVYQNWQDPVDAGITYFAEGTGGGVGTRLTRLKTDASGAITEIAHAQNINPNPVLATYVLDQSYVTNANGWLGAITNALSEQTTVTRDPNTGYITAVTTAGGNTTSVTYNANQRILSQTDALGVVTNMTYDASDNMLTQTMAVGTPRQVTWSYTYNTKGLMTSVTTPLGGVTEFAYDGQGRLLSVTSPPDVPGGPRAVKTFQFDNLGRRAAEIDPLGRRTTFSYDARGRMVTTTFPDSSTNKTIFGTGSLAGFPVAQTDRNGARKAFEYDQTRRMVTKIESDSQPSSRLVETVEYFPGRYIRSALVADGARSENLYDVRDREIQKLVFVNNTKTLSYQKSWDAANRIVTETDPYGRKTAYIYDSNGQRLRRVWELVPGALNNVPNLATLGRITSANPPYSIEDDAYDRVGRVVSHTDPRGMVISYVFDELGRPTQLIEAVGSVNARTTSYQYDAGNNLLFETNPRSTTAYTYNGRNMRVSKTEAFGTAEAVTFRRTFTLTGAIATSTDPKGGAVTYTYAATDDRVISIRDRGGFVATKTYDPLGHPLTITDPNGLVTRFAYDGRNRKIKQTDGAGQTMTFQYDDDLTDGVGLDANHLYASAIDGLGFGADAHGHAMKVTNAAGETRLVATDSIGRKLLEVDGLGNATRTSFDTVTNGLVEIKVTSALGQVTTMRKDPGGNTREAVDPDGNLIRNGFDPAGNQVSTRDAAGIGKDCSFTDLNQRAFCRNTDGKSTSWTYDEVGNIIQGSDGNGNGTTCQYDALNRKTSCTDRVGGTRTFAYDANSNLVATRDAENGLTTYTYDARNLQTSMTYPDSTGGTDRVTLTFDGGRRVVTTTDQSGNTLRNVYDGANRVTKTIFPDGRADTFDYDGAGRLLKADSGLYDITTTRKYDVAGRLVAETTDVDDQDYRTFYDYDGASRLTDLTYPDGSRVTQRFELNRDLVTEVKTGSLRLARYSYDASGRLTNTAFGNGLDETRTYGAGNNTISQISTEAVGTLSYTYDGNYNKLSETGTAAFGDQVFTYDDEDRLIGWTGPSLTQSWTLSPEADWTSTSRNGAVETRMHNAAHELTAVGSTPLQYDPRGNLTRDDKNNQLTWDFTNRLKRFQKAHGETIEYRYDALGRRVVRKEGKSKVVSVFAGEHVIAEYEDGHLATKFIFGPGIDNHLAYTERGRFFWFSNDPIHTVKAVTSDHGSVVERYRYTAYGERTVLSPAGAVIAATTVNNAIGFTGRPHDPDTGLVDFRARQYHPRLGRFISRDGAGYVNGHSLYRGYFAPNMADPSGNAWYDPFVDAGRAVVGAGEDIARGAAHGIETAVNTGLDLLNEGFQGIEGLVGDIGDAILDAGRFLGTELWAGAQLLGNVLWAGAQWAGGKLVELAVALGQGAWRLPGEILQDTWDNIKILASTTWNLAVAYFKLDWDILRFFWLTATGHPLDALKVLIAGYGNFYIEAFSAGLVYGSILGGYMDPIGGPTTWLGIGLGVTGWLFFGGDPPQIHWHNGGFVYEFPNSPLDFGDYSRTLGRAILYTGNPEDNRAREHEWQHVTQYGLLGETYIPLHLTSIGVSYGISLVRGEPTTGDAGANAYSNYDLFELGPYQANHETPWPRIPRIPWD